MRLSVSRILLLVCALLAVVPAAANAATTPKVTKVTPLQLKIGQRLTIHGKGFLAGKNRNTVIFKAAGVRAVFVKAETATSTKLVVKVPAKLAPFLKVTGGKAIATRFQIRVLARKLSPTYTPVSASPVIAPVVTAATTAEAKPATPAPAAAAAAATPAAIAAPPIDTDGDGTPDATDADDDDDLLPDVEERTIGTSTVSRDTDGDGMEDGWEYQSAKDLNAESCPAGDPATPCRAAVPWTNTKYPVKGPYPSPLAPDSAQDYDGDYLPGWWEHEAWKLHGRSLTDMWYSDGLQASQDSQANDGCRGLVEETVNETTDGNHNGVLDAITGHVDKYPLYELAPSAARDDASQYRAPYAYRYAWLYGRADYTLDRHSKPGDPPGCLTDDERDEDGDFLSNRDEVNTMMTGPDYVHALFEEPPFKVEWPGTNALDRDSDGDDIVDGMDDQDHDDFWNAEEIVRGAKSASRSVVQDGNDPGTDPDVSSTDTGIRTGLWVDPFNGCLPAVYSRGCPLGVFLDKEAWRPFETKDGTAPPTRWPLYNVAYYTGEIWGEVGPGVDPAAHDIPATGDQVVVPYQPGDPAADNGDGTRQAEHPLPRPF